MLLSCHAALLFSGMDGGGDVSLSVLFLSVCHCHLCHSFLLTCHIVNHETHSGKVQVYTLPACAVKSFHKRFYNVSLFLPTHSHTITFWASQIFPIPIMCSTIQYNAANFLIAQLPHRAANNLLQTQQADLRNEGQHLHHCPV